MQCTTRMHRHTVFVLLPELAQKINTFFKSVSGDVQPLPDEMIPPACRAPLYQTSLSLASATWSADCQTSTFGRHQDQINYQTECCMTWLTGWLDQCVQFLTHRYQKDLYLVGASKPTWFLCLKRALHWPLRMIWVPFDWRQQAIRSTCRPPDTTTDRSTFGQVTVWRAEEQVNCTRAGRNVAHLIGRHWQEQCDKDHGLVQSRSSS